MGLELLHALAGARAQGDDRHADRDGLDIRELEHRVLGEVDLVRDDHRARPAVPRRGEVPLEPARVEVAAERGHEEDRVDVRRHDLGNSPRQSLLPGERGAAWQDGFDHGLPLAVERPGRDPVADGRKLVLAETAGGNPSEPSELGQELARPMVARRNASRNQVVLFVGPERVLEELVPAEVLQVQRRLLWLGERKSALVGAR